MKKTVFTLITVMLILLTGCAQHKSEGIIGDFDIKINGKPANIDFTDGTALFYNGEGSVEITDAKENSAYVKGDLSVKGIKLNDTFESVVKALEIKPGFAALDYEYDPYGDGCTEIGSEIYNGKLPDLEELHVLDINLQAAYFKENGKWEIIDQSKHALTDFDKVLTVSVDFNGVCEIYADKPGVAVSITVRLA